MKNTWVSSNLTIKIIIRIFNTTVKPVLLYGAKTWKNTAATMKKIQTFIYTCLRRFFSRSDCLRLLATKNEGNGPSNNQQKMRFSKDAGDGLDTPPESQ